MSVSQCVQAQSPPSLPRALTTTGMEPILMSPAPPPELATRFRSMCAVRSVMLVAGERGRARVRAQVRRIGREGFRVGVGVRAHLRGALRDAGFGGGGAVGWGGQHAGAGAWMQAAGSRVCVCSAPPNPTPEVLAQLIVHLCHLGRNVLQPARRGLWWCVCVGWRMLCQRGMGAADAVTRMERRGTGRCSARHRQGQGAMQSVSRHWQLECWLPTQGPSALAPPWLWGLVRLLEPAVVIPFQWLALERGGSLPQCHRGPHWQRSAATAAPAWALPHACAAHPTPAPDG